jgi:hypothetical protein
MSGSRTYTLPRNSYSGTVSGVTVSYNSGTLSAMEGIENEGLKTAMEDIVIRAALERGFTSVVIRYILIIPCSYWPVSYILLADRFLIHGP